MLDEVKDLHIVNEQLNNYLEESTKTVDIARLYNKFAKNIVFRIKSVCYTIKVTIDDILNSYTTYQKEVTYIIKYINIVTKLKLFRRKYITILKNSYTL